MDDRDAGLVGAPMVEVPWTTFVSVEHPGVVKNIDYAIESFGGASRLATFLNDPPEHQVISCKLRPEDPFRNGIPHSTVEVSDVVLRIRVPKRTGRRRKRGSTDPFHFPSDDPRARHERPDTTEYLVQSLRDRHESAQFEPVGIVDESHRFRRLPDFQFSMMTSNMAKRLTRHILPFKLQGIKDFQLDVATNGLQDDMDMIPPPSFAPLDLPYHYHYLDNPNASINREENTTGKLREYLSHMQIVAYDVEPDKIPQGPKPDLTPEHETLEHVQILIRRLREECFTRRKVMTRRVALNFLGLSHNYDMRIAAPYASYMFRSGPFRDCYISYGFDPRVDQSTHIYQALSFKIPTRAADEGRVKGKNTFHRSLKTQSDDPNSRVFDGEALHTDGKVWQLADITDPVLCRILEDETRPECDIRADGWLRNGTMGKIRVIMKHKIDSLARGEVQPDEFYEPLLAFPADIADDYSLPLSRSVNGRELSDLGVAIKTQARNSAKISYTMAMLVSGAKKPSIKSKPKHRASATPVGGLDQDNVDGDEDSVRDEDEDEDAPSDHMDVE